MGDLGRFLRMDVWRTRTESLSRGRASLVRKARIFLAAWRGFLRDECMLRAAALTLYSLLSLVPLAAMAFGIAKGFGYEKTLEAQLLENFPENELVMRQVIAYANNLLATTRGGVVAGAGIAFLFVTVILTLSSFEDSFNTIWKIRRARSAWHKMNDYLSVMLIGPLLLIMSSSLTLFLFAKFENVVKWIGFSALDRALELLFLALLPLVLIWLLLTFLFKFMPNTAVPVRAAFYAAVLAGILYQVTQWVYVSFQIGVTRYNAIYGSLAALPLFLTWLQLSWMIVLFGGEVSYSIANADAYVAAGEPVLLSPLNRRILSLLIVRKIVRAFAAGEKPLKVRDLSGRLGTPEGLVRRILSDCLDCGLVAATVVSGDEEPAYQPTSPVARYTVMYVLTALERHGPADLPALSTPELESLVKALEGLAEAAESAGANKPLKDI